MMIVVPEEEGVEGTRVTGEGATGEGETGVVWVRTEGAGVTLVAEAAGLPDPLMSLMTNMTTMKSTIPTNP